MDREFNVLIERDEERYYIASVPAIRGCPTQAKSLDELMNRVREAIAVCLESEPDDIDNLQLVSVQVVSVPG